MQSPGWPLGHAGHRNSLRVCEVGKTSVEGRATVSQEDSQNLQGLLVLTDSPTGGGPSWDFPLSWGQGAFRQPGWGMRMLLPACLPQLGAKSPPKSPHHHPWPLVTAFWWRRTKRSEFLAVALAAGGVDPEAKVNTVGEGRDRAAKFAVLGGHAGTTSPDNRVTFP